MSHGTIQCWAAFTYTTLPWKSLAVSFPGKERDGAGSRERERDISWEREREGREQRERERERERDFLGERKRVGRSDYSGKTWSVSEIYLCLCLYSVHKKIIIIKRF